jgi:branched-chain amino acid transport system ATP-binding protein
VTKKFGGLTAVDDLSIKVKRGTIHSIIGPNGAGKTTLVNMITGVYKVTSGTIFLDGKEITNIATNKLVYKGVCRTFQHLEICSNLTAIENVMLGFDKYMNKNLFKSCFRFKSIIDDEKKYFDKSMELLKMVGLEEYAHTQAQNLSYGILKKIEIIRALATSPEIILLDEPVAGLNPNETAEISKIIKDVAHSGVTIVLIEHDMKMVMKVSDSITVMNFGKKLAFGTPSEIANNEEVITAYLGNGAFHGH